MKNTQAIIFDLYGTLIYLATKSKPFRRLTRELKLDSIEKLDNLSKIALTENFENLEDFVNRINANPNINLEKYQKEIEKEIASATLYNETLEVLKELKYKNIQLGLISNLATPYKIPFFELGLHNFFNQVLFSCDVGLLKPNPEIYRRMIKKLNTQPNKVIMIGDTLSNDFDGPKLIGINPIYLNRTSNLSNSISTLDGVFHYIK